MSEAIATHPAVIVNVGFSKVGIVTIVKAIKKYTFLSELRNINERIMFIEINIKTNWIIEYDIMFKIFGNFAYK
jgi:hypothetical protein